MSWKIVKFEKFANVTIFNLFFYYQELITNFELQFCLFQISKQFQFIEKYCTHYFKTWKTKNKKSSRNQKNYWKNTSKNKVKRFQQHLDLFQIHNNFLKYLLFQNERESRDDKTEDNQNKMIPPADTIPLLTGVDN